MSSSVFFKFKSSKDPQRIDFDGTGISVFELKREIINVSGLGDGTDFDLLLFNEKQTEEYDDDTTIIPRSSHVVASRRPAIKPGHGRAARYVSGKAPVNAKNSYRAETSTGKPVLNGQSATSGVEAMNNAQTEEEKIAAMFKAGGDQWQEQQQKMASAKPVFRPGKNKPVNVPDHDPPPGYVCYRCGQKGHWIQVCPTNDDPSYENRPRLKKTTGIPRSMLQRVEKPIALANDGLTDDTRQPSGVMINAAGEYVIAKPDEASWQQYQAKAKVSAAQQEAAAAGSKEVRDRGLECPIDKRIFENPTKTPCCGKTYCNDCIENALINSDFVCPNCSKQGILLDNLVPDDDMVAGIKAYEEEKAAERKVKEPSKSPKGANATPSTDKPASTGQSTAKLDSPPKSGANTPATGSATPVNNGAPKKRPAEEELKNDRIPTAPAAMRAQQAQAQQVQQVQSAAQQKNGMHGPSMMGNQQLPNGNFMPFPGMNGMSFPNQMGMMGMSMSGPMNPSMAPMSQGMMNPMMMAGTGWPNIGGMGGMGMSGMGMGGMGNMGFANQSGFMGGFNNMMGNGGYGQGWQGNQGWGMNGMSQQQPQPQPQQQQQQQQQNFPNQQKTVFSEPFPNEEDNAYFRKPVNPHRHQNRQKRLRPSDYTEL